MRRSRRARRRLIVLLALTFIAAVTVFAVRMIQAVQHSRTIAEARRAGLAAYAAGDLNRTLDELKVYFQYHKDDLEVNLAFADARARLPLADGKNLAEAIDLYTTHGLKLIDAQPALADASKRRREIMGHLLRVYGQAGLRFDLEQTADRILAIEPDSIDAMAAKTEALLLERRFDDAMPIAQRMIELDPDNLRWRRLALEIQSGQGAPEDKLVEQGRAWSQGYQGDGRFHLLTAGMLLEMDRADEAAAELQLATRLGADTQEVLEKTVGILDLMDLREQSDQLIAATQRKFAQEPWVREVGIHRLWQANRLDQTLSELEQARHDLPRLSPGLRRLQVLAFIAAGRPDDVRSALQPLLQESGVNREGDADRTWGQAVMASLDLSESNWHACIDALQNALALSPNDAVLHFLMGDACAKMGEHSQALAYYKQAFEIDPDWMAAGIAYADALLAAGRLDEAYKTSRVVVSRSARDRLTPFLLYARTYMALRESGVAVQLAVNDSELARDVIGMLERLNAELPQNADVASLLADAYSLNGDADAAKAFMARVADDAEAQPQVLLALADVSMRRRLGMEQRLLEQAQAEAGLNLPLAFAKAQVLAANGDSAAGLKLIDQAIVAGNLDPVQMRRAKCARSAYLLETKNPEAGEVLDRLVAEYPVSSEVQQFVLGQSAIWSDTELVAKAMANLKKILGERSPQVRLAEANFLLRHHADDEPLLAKAILQVNSVLEQSPDSLAGLSLMAEASTLGAHPNIDRSIDCLQRAANLYPGEANLLIRLISLLQQKGNFSAAGRYLRDLAQLSDARPQLQSVELRLLQSQDDFESALVRAAAIVNESSPPSDQLMLAAIRQRAGRTAEAQKIYDRLLEAPAPEALVLSQAAEFYADTGRFQRGLELIQKLQLPDSGAAKEVIIGGFYERHGYPQEADQWLGKAVANDPKSVDARNELARHYLALQDRAKARQQAIEGLKIDPTNSGLKATFALSLLGAASADRQQAANALHDLGSDNNDLTSMLQLLDKIPVRDSKSAPTEANLAQAQHLIDQHGQFLPVWLMAISLHIEAGRLPDAITLARNAVSRLPGQPEPSQWATQLLIESHRWNEALIEAQEWRRRAVGQPIAVDAVIASILLELNRAGDAAQQLAPYAEQLIAERERAPDRYRVWLKVLAFSGRYDQAAKLIGPLLGTDPSWRELWLTIANGLDENQAYEALSMLEPAVSDPQELLSLALEWSNLGKRSGRDECLDRADGLAARAGENAAFAARARIARGAIAEARHDLPGAEKHYRQALDREPENAVALNNLAYVLAKSARPEEALPHVQKALKLQPNQPDLLDTYGQVLLGLNRLDDAEAALKQALAQRPDDLDMFLNLVDVELHQNRLEDAERDLDEIQRRIRFVPHADPQQLRRLETLRQQLPRAQSAAGT